MFVRVSQPGRGPPRHSGGGVQRSTSRQATPSSARVPPSCSATVPVIWCCAVPPENPVARRFWRSKRSRRRGEMTTTRIALFHLAIRRRGEMTTTRITLFHLAIGSKAGALDSLIWYQPYCPRQLLVGRRPSSKTLVTFVQLTSSSALRRSSHQSSSGDLPVMEPHARSHPQ